MNTSARLAQAMDLLERLESGAPAKVQANFDAFSPGRRYRQRHSQAPVPPPRGRMHRNWLAPLQVQANFDAFSPEAAELVLGYAFADIVGREGIDLRTREMLTVAMLAALGTAPGQLEFHVRAALNTGVTREEIIEIVLQVSVYAGVPACMNAITAVKKALAASKAV